MIKARLIKLLALIVTLCVVLTSCAELEGALDWLLVGDSADSDTVAGDNNNDSTTGDPSDNNNPDDNNKPDDNNQNNPGGNTPDDPSGGNNNDNPGGNTPDDPSGGNNNDNPGDNTPDDPSGGNNNDNPGDNTPKDPEEIILTGGTFDFSKVPAYTDSHYYVVNGNVPFFTESDLTLEAFEQYGELDTLGRCTLAFACLSRELMPSGTRPSISFEPTGWVQNRYPTSVIAQQDIYNRSHLIAWSLAGEGNNHNNLMTGTPYFNQLGMQEFENMVHDYIKETGNHVLYRVTPIFVGDNLLANGVLMEAYSVEDKGAGIAFNVFMYNVQPGIRINYATGENELESAGEIEKRYPIYSNTFDTSLFGNQNDTYTSYTKDGWSIVNSSLISAETMGADTIAAVLNGNTSKPGKLTSATIEGGISKLAFDYGFFYKDTQVSLTVNVKQDGKVVATKTIDVSGLTSNVAYEFNWVLDEAVEGDFTIEIINNCKTGTNKNKDRVSIFNISWENA